MIIVAINECFDGSTGNIARFLLNEASKKGHTCYFAFRSGNCHEDNCIKIYENPFLALCSKIESKIDGSDGFHSKKATQSFIKKLSSIKPDIVHIHNLHGSYINLPILLSYLKRNNIKVVWTFHDCWPFTGRCAHFDFCGCQKWKTYCHDCSFKNMYPKSFFLDKSKKYYSIKKRMINALNDIVIVSPSFWMDNLLTESFLGNKKHLCIYNGIDPLASSFDRLETKRINAYVCTNKYKKIVFSAAYPFSKKKGIDYILKLANDSRLQNVLFLIAGLSGKQNNNLPANVLSLGIIKDRAKMNSYYRLADVFLNPTLEEVFGLVNVESMLNGTPVITFNSGGSPEIITEKTGTVIERGDYEGLVNAIIFSKKTSEIENQCVKRALLFTDERMSKEYIKVYESFEK